MATAEDIATVRLLIADTATDEADRLLTDAQVTSFLTLNSANTRLAAADALEAIAVSEVLVSKKIRTQDLTTDGPAVAAELRRLAALHRDLAAKAEDDAAGWDGFDVVATVPASVRPEAAEHITEIWGL